jgi:hypothetical protein
MKKLALLFSLVATSLFAQSTFWTPTVYRGAFEPAPALMWTDSWTNFDPQSTVYPAVTDVVSDSITVNTVWTTGKTYLVQGPL